MLSKYKKGHRLKVFMGYSVCFIFSEFLGADSSSYVFIQVTKGKTIIARVHPTQKKDFNQLIQNPHDDGHLANPCLLTLAWEVSLEHQKLGAFKMAYIGIASENLFGSSTRICIKQTFYTKTKDVQQFRASKITTQTRKMNIVHDPIKQASGLTMEITCLVWAQALLDLVYVFVDEYLKAQDTRPPFPIPVMRFVDAALAVEQNGDGQVYLLEEVVEEANEGKFRKFVNNDSAVPPRFKDEGDKHRSEFLTFTQHVQYWKTKKTAFVSDYQGEQLPEFIRYSPIDSNWIRWEHAPQRPTDCDTQVCSASSLSLHFTPS
jgi:hypothetical protein